MKKNHAFLTFTASATHFLRSTTHRVWSRVNESGVCSKESTCTECPFCFHRSGLDGKQSFTVSVKIGRR